MGGVAGRRISLPSAAKPTNRVTGGGAGLSLRLPELAFELGCGVAVGLMLETWGPVALSVASARLVCESVYESMYESVYGPVYELAELVLSTSKQKARARPPIEIPGSRRRGSQSCKIFILLEATTPPETPGPCCCSSVT